MHRVDLVVPGLSNLPVHEIPAHGVQVASPSLQLLLRFARLESAAGEDIDDILAACLGLQQQALPYARSLASSGQTAQLLIKPIHLKTDINNAIVFPLSDSDEHINIIINDLSDYFKEDCTIEAVADGVWSMRLHHCSAPADVPHYLSATGKKVTHYLEQAKANLDWFRLINEMQMYLHQHAVNQQRFNAGQPMINSLWCWGADDYRGESVEHTRWYSDDWLMQHIGRLYCEHADPVKRLASDGIQADSIVVNLSILKALKGEGSGDVVELLQQLESRYLRPILAGAACELRLHTGAGGTLVYRPSMRWKLWKPSTAGWFK